jgi:methyl-accepting chemotaxis protein
LDRFLNRVEEPQSEVQLRRKARWAFTAAVLLTGILGLLSWHTAEQAAGDADWVAHTHEVSTTLEATLRHSVDVETGGRGFAETGSEPFLEPYESGRQALGSDLHALRRLVVDPELSQRFNILEGQSNAQVSSVEMIVAARQDTGRVPTVAQFELGKRLMNAVRMTVDQMEARLKRLLEQRAGRARMERQFTKSIIASGSLLGVVFLTLAGFSVVREIGVSAQARAQVKALN